MSYSVICPSCNEKNSGSALSCVKCHTDLIGIPRIENTSSEYETAIQQESIEKSQAAPFKGPKIESLGHALWRSFQGSLVIFLLASLFTGLICFWVTGAHYPILVMVLFMRVYYLCLLGDSSSMAVSNLFGVRQIF